VRPITDETALNKLADVPLSDLRPEFQAQLASLKEKVFGDIKPKSLFGRPLNGAMLAQLAEIYCTALNSNETPMIRNAWERVADQQCQKAVDKATDAYKVGMADVGKGDDVLEMDQLAAKHQVLLHASLSQFDAEAVQDCDTYEQHKQALLEVIDHEHSKVVKKNAKNSEDLCENVWTRVFDSFESELEQVRVCCKLHGICFERGYCLFARRLGMDNHSRCLISRGDTVMNLSAAEMSMHLTPKARASTSSSQTCCVGKHRRWGGGLFAS
jgi:hypothetical protein